MVDEVEQRCGAPPAQRSADSGFFSIDNLNRMEQRNIDAYVPDSNMACALNLGTRCRTRACAPAHRRMRAKLRSPAGQAAYARRKASSSRSSESSNNNVEYANFAPVD
jgi:hypothetical protein